MLQQILRCLWVVVDECIESVEGVKEKMGVQLKLECGQLRFRQLGLCLEGAGFSILCQSSPSNGLAAGDNDYKEHRIEDGTGQRRCSLSCGSILMTRWDCPERGRGCPVARGWHSKSSGNDLIAQDDE